METANRNFRSCCQAMALNNACLSVCNYNSTLPQFRKARGAGCKRSEERKYLICASAGQDVTKCCRAYGTFYAQTYCKMLCRPSDKRWVADYEEIIVYWPCIRFIEGILHCMHILLPAE
ncbi:unnamed protein product [Soboliphyme baturini]|uniref:DB domain-containing protein n=1 Tax=Soboliphyme baturini TaxID=241478 RepID=A0A183J7T7_9BILA|nr:unnamed protein product [Soboliphyme baturini]